MANEFRKVTDQNGVDHPVCDDTRVDWSSYAKTGAYNSLNIDSYSLTANGTTVTNITGGKNIKVSNTAWQYAGADFIIANPYKGEHQIFDCDADYVAGTLGIVIMTNSSASASGATTIATSGYFTEDKHVTLEFDGGSANYFIIRFILNGSGAGAGEINVTNLMISPKGGSYVPYTMTNEELTESLTNNTLITTGLSYNKCSYVSGGYCKVGSLVLVNIKVKASESIATWNTIISGLPKAPHIGSPLCVKNNSNNNFYQVDAFDNDIRLTGVAVNADEELVINGVYLNIA